MRNSHCFIFCVALLLAVAKKEEQSWSSPNETFYKIQWKRDGFLITVEGQFRQYGAVLVAKRKLADVEESWCPLASEIKKDRHYGYLQYWSPEERNEFQKAAVEDDCFGSAERKGYFITKSEERGKGDDKTGPEKAKNGGNLWLIVIVVVAAVGILVLAGAIVGLCTSMSNDTDHEKTEDVETRRTRSHLEECSD